MDDPELVRRVSRLGETTPDGRARGDVSTVAGPNHDPCPSFMASLPSFNG